jgi:hypothetical protein
MRSIWAVLTLVLIASGVFVAGAGVAQATDACATDWTILGGYCEREVGSYATLAEALAATPDLSGQTSATDEDETAMVSDNLGHSCFSGASYSGYPGVNTCAGGGSAALIGTGPFVVRMDAYGQDTVSPYVFPTAESQAELDGWAASGPFQSLPTPPGTGFTSGDAITLLFAALTLGLGFGVFASLVT